MSKVKAIQDFIMSTAKNPVAQRAALGAGGGALLGRYVTPKAFGYEDNPGARNMSTFMDAVLYGTLGAIGPKRIGEFVKADPKAAVGLGAGLTGAEIIPVGMDTVLKGRGAITEGSKSVRDLAEASKGIRPNPSMTEQLAKILSSREARGAGVGAALAGLGAMGSGLMRAKTDREREEDASRAGMVGSDFLKYLVPAMLAGGLVGNVTKPDDQPA